MARRRSALLLGAMFGVIQHLIQVQQAPHAKVRAHALFVTPSSAWSLEIIPPGHAIRPQARQSLAVRRSGHRNRVPASSTRQATNEAMVIVTSSPANGEHEEPVFKLTLDLCKLHPSRLAIAYDWDGSALAGDGDGWSDINRAVQKYNGCSLPNQTAFDELRRTITMSRWFAKYKSKVIGFVESNLRQNTHDVIMFCIDGGPISQVEQSEVPRIKQCIKEQLQQTGTHISSSRLRLATGSYDDLTHISIYNQWPESRSDATMLPDRRLCINGLGEFSVMPAAPKDGKCTEQHLDVFKVPQGWEVVSQSDSDFEMVREQVVRSYSWTTHMLMVLKANGDAGDFLGLSTLGFGGADQNPATWLKHRGGDAYQFTGQYGRLLLRKKITE